MLARYSNGCIQSFRNTTASKSSPTAFLSEVGNFLNWWVIWKGKLMNRKKAKNLLKSRGFESLMAKLWQNDEITNSNDYVVFPFNISLAICSWSQVGWDSWSCHLDSWSAVWGMWVCAGHSGEAQDFIKWICPSYRVSWLTILIFEIVITKYQYNKDAKNTPHLRLLEKIEKQVQKTTAAFLDFISSTSTLPFAIAQTPLSKVLQGDYCWSCSQDPWQGQGGVNESIQVSKSRKRYHYLVPWLAYPLSLANFRTLLKNLRKCKEEWWDDVAQQRYFVGYMALKPMHHILIWFDLMTSHHWGITRGTCASCTCNRVPNLWNLPLIKKRMCNWLTGNHSFPEHNFSILAIPQLQPGHPTMNLMRQYARLVGDGVRGPVSWKVRWLFFKRQLHPKE